MVTPFQGGAARTIDVGDDAEVPDVASSAHSEGRVVSVASSKTQYRIRRKHSPCRYRLRIRQVVVNALKVDSGQGAGRSLEGEEVGLCRLGLTS